MAISFQCANPDCRKAIRAPDGTEGQSARCPACQMVQVVPYITDVDDNEVVLFDESPPSESHPLRCGECRGLMLSDSPVCPRCGWVDPDSVPGRQQPSRASTFHSHCLGALHYGVSNVSSLVKLLLWSLLLGGLLYMLIAVMLPFFLILGVVGLLGMVLLVAACGLAFSGYFLRYYLDCAIASLEGQSTAPDVPEFDFKELMMTGLSGAGIVLVYILPIITLPLLPLALLGWAYANDNRIFDPRWMLRAWAKKAGPIALLCAFLIGWGIVEWAGEGAVLYGADRLMDTLRYQGGVVQLFGGLIVGVVAGSLISLIFHTMMVVQFRCIGMLGRFHNDLLDLLPDRASGGVVAGTLAAGAILSLVIWTAAPVINFLGKLSFEQSTEQQVNSQTTRDREPSPERSPDHSTDATPMGYLQTVIRSRDTGKLSQSRLKLRSLHQELQIAQVAGNWPDNRDALAEQIGNPRLLRSSFDPTLPIVYLPPPPSAGNDWVLFFDPVQYRDYHVVLFKDGRVDLVEHDPLFEQVRDQSER